MKKLLVLVLGVMVSSVLTTRVNTNEMGINFYGHSEAINVNELREIATKYNSNQENLLDYTNLVAPESNPNGSLDYTDYKDDTYSRQTTFTKNNYFENLYEYSPNNNIGSCGYVSLIQALSYYDTFYNDNIIPDMYDYNLDSATSEASIKSHSPGVVKQSYNSSDYTSYYQYCHSTQGYDLQSKLTVLQNVLSNTDNDGTQINSEGETVSNFGYSIGGWSYQSLLNRFYSEYSGSVMVNGYSNKTQSEFVNLIKDVIGTGNPIIVHIKKYNSSGEEVGFHSVVAYEHNEAGIFSNYGWGSGDTHTQLLGGTNGYSQITNAYTLDFSSMGHTHSNNYIINGKGHCGCNISDEILFKVPTNWKNVPPTLYWMKDFYDSNETYSISFKSSKNGSNLFSYTTSFNQITLSPNAWSSILQACNGNIYVTFKRNSSNGVNYYNAVTYTYSEPSKSMDRIVLSPSEYGFEQRYFFENEGIKNLPIQQGNYTIGTTRLRCGYIEQEYIVLSPRRENAGKAYLIYNFDCKVYRIDVDLTMWSSSENLDKTYDTAKLQYKVGYGSWKDSLDLLNDISLSTNRINPEHYTVVFPEGVTSIRFYVESSAVGSRNKGRICIGDMDIYLSGDNQ